MLCALLLYCPSCGDFLLHSAEKASGLIPSCPPSLLPWIPNGTPVRSFPITWSISVEFCASLNLTQPDGILTSQTLAQCLPGCVIHYHQNLLPFSLASTWSLTSLLSSPRGHCCHRLPLSEGCFSPNSTYHGVWRKWGRTLFVLPCHFLSILIPSPIKLPIFSEPIPSWTSLPHWSHLKVSESLTLTLWRLAPGALSLTKPPPVIELGDFQICVEHPSLHWPLTSLTSSPMILSFTQPQPSIDLAVVSNHACYKVSVVKLSFPGFHFQSVQLTPSSHLIPEILQSNTTTNTLILPQSLSPRISLPSKSISDSTVPHCNHYLAYLFPSLAIFLFVALTWQNYKLS